MPQDEKGMTLVEVLAVLVLLSLVTGIIWTTLSISIKHNTLETTKLQLQQEANSVISKLQEIHRYNDCYKLTVETERIEVTNCAGSEKEFREVLTTDYIYKAIVGKTTKKKWTSKDILELSDITNLIVKPKESNLEFGGFFVKNRGDSKLFINIPTIISRYRNLETKEE